MRYYIAPMEGITGYIYRGALQRFFCDGIDRFYTPFVVYHEKCILSNKDIRDIEPLNNVNQKLIPQVITNKASEYLALEKAIMEYGYEEININLGCPSKTVISKKRGAGLLGDLELLDNMLYKIFAGKHAKVSVKTRLGVYDADEFFKILDIYNKYELCELIIHPRIQTEFYTGQIHKDMYQYATVNSKNPICFNGDIKSVEDKDKIYNEFCPDSIMIGRGIIANPSLIRECNGGKAYNVNEIKEYLNYVTNEYMKVFSGDTPVLYKMKEIWSFMEIHYPDQKKNLKKLFKAKSLSEYKAIENVIISNHE